MKKTLLPLLFIGLAAGCGKQNASRIMELQNQVTTLNSNVADLQKQATILSTLTSNQNLAISYLWNQELLMT